jgi:hypothetical protein
LHQPAAELPVLKLKNPATDRQYRVLQNQSMMASQKLTNCGVTAIISLLQRTQVRFIAQ